MTDQDCIVAIATPPGEGAIGIVRLSGPQAPQILAQIFTSKTPVDYFESHKLYLGTVVQDNGSALDQAMAVWMRAPHSFTGEDCVELHCHGGKALLETILSLLLRTGARLARSGEFSERAFLNGKIDLAQAEAICDLIRAKSEKALEASFGQLSGHVSAVVNTLKDELVAVKAQLEAGIDFPDEDISPETLSKLERRLHGANAHIASLITSFERGRILREGLRIVIAGKPNVGKSSLLNALLGEARAIVHESAGTTRDFIEESFVLEGIPIRIIDTAGIRQHAASIEHEGIARTKVLLNHADLVLALFDGSQTLDDEDRDVFAHLDAKPCVLWIKTKADLLAAWQSFFSSLSFLSLSIRSGFGLDELKKAIVEIALGHAAQDSETCTITHIRHKEALVRANDALGNAAHALSEGLSGEYAASDLNLAIDHLKEITGEITHDDVLDKLFREFCIGK